MALVPLVAVPLLASLSPEPPASLSAAASATPRPSECAAQRGTWWRFRRSRGDHCLLLARGYAALSSDPEAALALGQAASDAEAPALVLQARALVALGRHAEAHRRFQRAEQLSPRSLASSMALHDRAVAAAFAGHLEVASQAFRQLVPRMGLLPASRRARAYIEAAMALARRDPQENRSEAIGYLNQVLSEDSHRGTAAFARAAMVLFKPERGRSEQGIDLSILSNWLQQGASPVAPRLPRADVLALVAAAHEQEEADEAAQWWRQYLDVEPQGPFRERAKRALRAME